MNGKTDMPAPSVTTTTPPPPGVGMHHHPMMHMTFFWGKNGDILFSGWPGSNSVMYTLVLIFVFMLAFLVEFLSHINLAERGSGSVAVGLVQSGDKSSDLSPMISA